MEACRKCSRHVLGREARCPFCGEDLTGVLSVSPRAMGLIFGLLLVACDRGEPDDGDWVGATYACPPSACAPTDPGTTGWGTTGWGTDTGLAETGSTTEDVSTGGTTGSDTGTGGDTGTGSDSGTTG